ncbi:hypothetical protein DL771_001491 [Monosporascus sp. 5C6A]|nr:hypothetical protein DL771_001491 [Monosporascus sp. 5C6A]
MIRMRNDDKQEEVQQGLKAAKALLQAAIDRQAQKARHADLHPVNCDQSQCPVHAEEKQRIYERVTRMWEEGFDFYTRTGYNQEDQQWYRELRASTTQEKVDDAAPVLTWPEGEGCPQGDPTCYFGWCDHQTQEELIQRSVDKHCQKAITEIQSQLAFEMDPRKRRTLREELAEFVSQSQPIPYAGWEAVEGLEDDICEVSGQLHQQEEKIF